MARKTTTFAYAVAASGALLAVSGLSSPLRGDDPPATAKTAEAPADAALKALSIDELTARLDSDSFDERQDASEELAERGNAAIPALERTAEEGSREAKSRALDILVTRAKADGQSDGKDAARAALERLSESSDAYAARRAGEALAPDADPNRTPPRQAFAPPIQIVPGFQGVFPGAPNIRVQVMAQNAGTKVERKNVNGEETTKVEEGDRRIEIHKTAAGKIEMTVTEKKDGQETVEKFAADNEADLKKNSPKAHELFEKYAGGNVAQARIAFGQAFPGGFPGGVPQPPNALPPGMRNANQARLDILKRMLENVRQQERRIADQVEELEEKIGDEDEAPAEDADAPQEEGDDEREAGSDAEGGSDD